MRLEWKTHGGNCSPEELMAVSGLSYQNKTVCIIKHCHYQFLKCTFRLSILDHPHQSEVIRAPTRASGWVRISNWTNQAGPENRSSLVSSLASSWVATLSCWLFFESRSYSRVLSRNTSRSGHQKCYTALYTHKDRFLRAV